jgi:hypothetical protein
MVCVLLILPSVAAARVPVPHYEFPFDDLPEKPAPTPPAPPCDLPAQPTLDQWQAKNDMETGVRMLLAGGGGFALSIVGVVGAATNFGKASDSQAPRIVGGALGLLGGLVGALLTMAGVTLYQKGHRVWPDHPHLQLTMVPDGAGGGNLALTF